MPCWRWLGATKTPANHGDNSMRVSISYATSIAEPSSVPPVNETMTVGISRWPHDAQLSSDGYLLQGYRHLKFPWQVRVVELVRVANAFVGHQFEILSAEGVSMSCGEIRERHFVGAADLGIQVVDLAGESVWRKPFGHRVGIQERPIDSLRGRTENAVKPDGVC